MTWTTIDNHWLRLRLVGAAILAAPLACASVDATNGSAGASSGSTKTNGVTSSVSADGTATESALDERCAAIAASIQSAGFDASVTVSCDGNYAYLAADTYPDHDLMNGIVGTNEQIPVPALDYASPVRLAPTMGSAPTSRDAALGVAINGVPIYDYSSAGELDLDSYDPSVDTLVLGQLDNCGGHAGRGDDYHYHVAPTCMIAGMANAGDDAIIGWGFDGYPIYGDRNPDGSPVGSGTLDVCNGQPDESFGYRYHTSPEPPYILQCLVGEVDAQNELPRVAPLSGANGQARPSGTPPQGGVDNLVHTVEGDTRTLAYEHEGESYYITYEPSGDPNCYAFEFKTVTNGGIVESGVYCR